MFTKEAAKSIKHILDSESEKEFNILLDDLIVKEQNSLQYNMPQTEIVAALARIGILKKLKTYKVALRQIYNGD